MAQAANEWLPTIRATVLAIVLGLFPLLVVFLVTPLMGRSVVVMVGLFAWLTLWGVADAVMHRSAMDQAMATVEEIQRHQMGITAMMLTPEAATKALAIFGKARSMGITIATFLSAVLFGFSAYALNQIAGSFQGRVDSAGSDAADRSLTPEGTGQTIGGVTAGVSSAFNLGNLGLGRMAMASAFNSGVELSRADQYLANTAVQGIGPAESVHAQGSIDAGAQHGNLLATQMNVAASGGEITSAGALLNAAREVTKLEQAQRFGEARGKVEAIQGAGFGNALDFGQFVSAYQTMMTAGDTRTHAANIDRFQDIHAQRTGEDLGNQDAADIYSRMRLASITGDINAFDGDADHAVDFMTMNRSLADHHLAGLVQGARALGTTPEVLAEAGGATQAAMQRADASQLASLPIGTIATGAFANRLMSTQTGAALSEVMQDKGIVEGIHALAETETLLRDANADQLQNLSDVTGMTMERLSMAVQGANRQLAFARDDVEGLVTSGTVGTAESSLVADGGVATLSISPDGQGITTSRVAGGSALTVDDSTAVSTGFGAGGANSAALLLTDPASEEGLEDVLRATEGSPVARDALKMDMATYLGSITSSDVQLRQIATGEAYAGWEVPGIANLVSGATAGVRGTVAGTIADSDAHNVNYGLVNRVFSSAYASAKQDVVTEANARKEKNASFSVEEREDLLFDRFALHLNADMGQLVSEQKGDHERAMLAAENMEDVPTSMDREEAPTSVLNNPNSLKAL